MYNTFFGYGSLFETFDFLYALVIATLYTFSLLLQAYKNFGQRVNNQRKKLEEHKKGLPSPIPSPSHDAPSPGNTPPHIAQQYDNTDTVDMDLSDDEGKTVFQAQ